MASYSHDNDDPDWLDDTDYAEADDEYFVAVSKTDAATPNAHGAGFLTLAAKDKLDSLDGTTDHQLSAPPDIERQFVAGGNITISPDLCYATVIDGCVHETRAVWSPPLVFHEPQRAPERVKHAITCPLCRRHFCDVLVVPGTFLEVLCPGCKAEGRAP